MTIFGHLNSLCIPAIVFFTRKCPANRLPWHLNNILLFNVSGTIFVWWLCLITHFQILFLIGLFGAISTLVFIFSSLLFNYILFFCVFLYFFVLYFLYFFSAFPLISLSRAFIQISPFSCSMANFAVFNAFMACVWPGVTTSSVFGIDELLSMHDVSRMVLYLSYTTFPAFH